jgi:hypothetical protein
MSRRVVLGCCVLGLMISWGFLLVRGGADEGKPRQGVEGRFVAVFLKRLRDDTPASSTYLARVGVQKLGEKWFLVGSRFELTDPVPATDEELLWVALDEVSGIQPFPTAERLKEYFRPKTQP